VSAPFDALVLAGSRPGPDPVAEYAGVAHKALIEVEGQTLLARVISALDEAGAARIGVSTNAPQVITLLATLKTRATLEHLAAQPGPSLSALIGAQELGTPLLITTCDHALLEASWVRYFVDAAPAQADIAVMLSPQAAVEAAAPGVRRTYLRFADGAFSGCNLFLLQRPQALNALRFWSRMEALRKTPWKVAMAIGPVTLVAYALRLLSLEGMLRRIGAKAGVTAAAVRSPFGLAAVDVDKPSDLDLVRRLTA